VKRKHDAPDAKTSPATAPRWPTSASSASASASGGSRPWAVSAGGTGATPLRELILRLGVSRQIVVTATSWDKLGALVVLGCSRLPVSRHL
jgi:hypothetical protein